MAGMAGSKRLVAVPGARYGRGTVIREVRLPITRAHALQGNKTGVRGVEMACDCGETYTALLANVLKGHTRSCGCLARESSAARLTEANRTGAHNWKRSKRCS